MSIPKNKKLTKKLRKEITQQIIDSYALNEYFDNYHLDILSAILDVKLYGVYRTLNPTYPSDPRHIMALLHPAGDYKAFSWNKAISPVSEEQEVKKAMRAYVQAEMDTFRMFEDSCCAECDATDHLTTDHIFPFENIAQIFISQHGLPELIDGEPGASKRFKSGWLEDLWRWHHQEYADYQILCRSCNSMKGATK